jgi:hypothetical protein
VIINFGKPIKYSFEEEKFKEKGYKRKVVTEMLEKLRIGMNKTKLTAPSYKELKNLYYVKEIYLTDEHLLSDKDNFKVYKKFCEGYSIVKEEKATKEIMEDINSFRLELKSSLLSIGNLKDYHSTFGSDFRALMKRTILLGLYLTPFFIVFVPIKYLVQRMVLKKR